MKTNLSNVTICAIDCITPVLAAEAINYSTQNVSFGDSILFSDEQLTGQFRSTRIPKLNSREEYSKFVLENLSEYVSTDYVLIVQWDGFVTSPESWDPNFLNYDYIGACWPWHSDGLMVGNGGFSIRSKKLMDLFKNSKFQYDRSLNEDEVICRQLRPQLENQGAKFAPINVARKFSYEREFPGSETFGFHGLFNIWRHCDDAKILDLANRLNQKTYKSVEFLELLLVYLEQRKFFVFKRLFNLLLANLESKSAEDHLAMYMNDRLLIEKIIKASQGMDIL